MSTYIDFRTIAEEALASCPFTNLYLLLDQSGLPDLHSKLSKSSSVWGALFDHTLDANASVVGPILISAGSKGNLQISRRFGEWLGRSGTYNSTVIMMLSPLDFEPLMARLVVRLDVTLSEGLDAMLRFFDPRILESMTKFLNAEQSNHFFSPAESWGYIDRAGALIWFKSDFSGNENFSPPLTLSQQQESDLLDASEVDQVLDLLRSNLPTTLARLPQEEQYGFAYRKIEEARQRGFTSISKLALYTATSLIEQENLVEDPS
ncbi:MAG: DUF4123 domain-containing protein [Proteobacteria bacterium]|nr:MAG: DUF4123 domain-containing protein [Pseudomonadota bacterium]